MNRRILPGAAIVLMAASAVILLLPSGAAPIAGPLDLTPSSGGAATLAVSPVRSVVTSDERESTVSYTLGNDGTRSRTYAITTQELSAQGAPFADAPGNAGRWVDPAVTEVVVPAHKSVTTQVRIRVPADRGANERRVGVTFRDITPIPGGTVTVRAQITTSVYIQGTGLKVRRAALSNLDLPLFAHDQIEVRARLANSGTVYLVPGSTADPIIGTTSTGAPFTLGGDVARPASAVSVLGIARDLPLACWCQVRLSVPDGKGGTSTLTGRTLVAPWPPLGAGFLAILLFVGVRVVRRRIATSTRPLLRTVRWDDVSPVEKTHVRV